MSVNSEENTPKERKKRPAKVICNIFDTEYDLVKQVTGETLGWRLTESEEDDWDLTWTDNSVPTEKLSKMKPYQKINHFPGMHGICKKNFLAWNLTRMSKYHPQDYDFFPKTWVLPGDMNDFKSYIDKKKFFIVKPEASSQGRGIFLIRKLDEINLSERCIVQEYISEPYLIDGLKFDLRIYALVTGCNPLRIYVHEDGLTRLATEKYIQPDDTNYEEMCMHLTNYAINKFSKKFVFNKDSNIDNVGHKRSLQSTFDYLRAKGENVDKIKEKIEDIIVKTMCSVQPSLAHVYKCCQPEDLSNSMCFEILGFDILFDKNLNPILLEVNHSPSFTADSPLDQKIKHRLLTETLKLVKIRAGNRKNYYKARYIDPQSRKAQVKSCKDIREERAEKTQFLQEQKEKWEITHCGGFKCLYPCSNKDFYSVFLKSAALAWGVMTGRNTKINKDKKNNLSFFQPAPKAKSTAARIKTNSNCFSHKVTLSSMTKLKAEETFDSEYDFIKKASENNKLQLQLLSSKNFNYYSCLAEAIANKRNSITFLKGSEFHYALMKLVKPSVKNKESTQGNFVVPKTFEFKANMSKRNIRCLSRK